MRRVASRIRTTLKLPSNGFLDVGTKEQPKLRSTANRPVRDGIAAVLLDREAC
jgi:hypothetical protein